MSALSGKSLVNFNVTMPPVMSAVAVAPLPLPTFVNVTVGADVYPVPGFVRPMLAIEPLSPKLMWPSAPEPPPPLMTSWVSGL